MHSNLVNQILLYKPASMSSVEGKYYHYNTQKFLSRKLQTINLVRTKLIDSAKFYRKVVIYWLKMSGVINLVLENYPEPKLAKFDFIKIS